MALFKVQEGKIKKLDVKSFKNEKELQILCERNLEELFQVKFVETEFPFGDEYSGRLDTIGVDFEGNPVIIEYKLDKNSAVLSQCLFYMDWLVNHKGDFEMTAKNKLGNNISINWNNPKMIIVAQDYNKYDKYAVNQIGYDIYLYKYTYYSSGEFYIENINVQENKKYSIANNNKNDSKEKYVRKDYSEEYHTKNSTENIKELYSELHDRIVDISDNVEVRYSKTYIGYRTTRNFAEIHLKKNSILIYFLEYDKDKERNLKIEKIPDSYQWVVNYRVEISKMEEIEELMDIIKYSYNNTL